ncbi:MAG TPA: TIGR03086 family metal-binding protein [Acidimicrobiia bacterium]|nr:TIGR03086 family metal-binding protein [Acidimicrobiia bacterium]
MSDLLAFFERAASGFGRHVHTIGDRQWHDPTPCTDWDVRRLVNHVTVEQLWVPPLAQGSTVGDIGARFDGDQLGDDPIATWDAAVQASRASFGAPDALDGTVSLSGGAKPTAEYCWEMTTDALIHSWDLARAIGADESLDAELAELVYERMLPVAASLQGTGMFAPPVPVPDDAPLPTKLLAIFGRRA